jgi:hypothetical protein
MDRRGGGRWPHLYPQTVPSRKGPGTGMTTQPENRTKWAADSAPTLGGILSIHFDRDGSARLKPAHSIGRAVISCSVGRQIGNHGPNLGERPRTRGVQVRALELYSLTYLN